MRWRRTSAVPTKQITEILTKYAENAQEPYAGAWRIGELSLIFEYLTQHNQVSGIQVIFAEGAKPAEKKRPALPPKPAEKKPEGNGCGRAVRSQAGRPSPSPVCRQTKVVDTRKATQR